MIRFNILFIVNDGWRNDTPLTIIDWRGIHEYSAEDALIEFYNCLVKRFKEDVVLLKGGKWSDYEKCIELS